MPTRETSHEGIFGDLIPVTLVDVASGRVGVQPEEGGLAAFVGRQAPGAIANGARVTKTTHEAGDFHEVGAGATVLGSVGPFEGEYGYFVRWDDWPDRPVFVRGRRIGPAT